MPDVSCIWTGTAFEPRGAAHRQKCDVLGAGEVVVIDFERYRSKASHNHQFAMITDLWHNLPETLADAPYAKSPDTLRKHALIATGHADCETVVTGSKASAERVSVSMSRLAKLAYGYAITRVEGHAVMCWTPHSQSVAAMGGKRFQQSKTDVLEWIEAKISGESKT